MSRSPSAGSSPDPEGAPLTEAGTSTDDGWAHVRALIVPRARPTHPDAPSGRSVVPPGKRPLARRTPGASGAGVPPTRATTPTATSRGDASEAGRERESEGSDE